MMGRMEIRRVDPRTVDWEDYQPAYRVYFWSADVASDEYELIGASDVGEVLQWADEQRHGRTYTVYAVVSNSGDGLGTVRLHGDDPTRTY
jgi:hypothetical protein